MEHKTRVPWRACRFLAAIRRTHIPHPLMKSKR